MQQQVTLWLHFNRPAQLMNGLYYEEVLPADENSFVIKVVGDPNHFMSMSPFSVLKEVAPQEVTNQQALMFSASTLTPSDKINPREVSPAHNEVTFTRKPKESVDTPELHNYDLLFEGEVLSLTKPIKKTTLALYYGQKLFSTFELDNQHKLLNVEDVAQLRLVCLDGLVSTCLIVEE